MSFNGILVYERNLRRLMDSEAFKNSDEEKRLDLAYRLYKSKFGLGAWFGFGRVHELPSPMDPSKPDG